MDKKLFKTIGFLFFAVMIVISCSEDNENSKSKEDESYVHMVIDGEMWKTDSSFEVKFVEQGLSVDENADSYIILLSALQSQDGKALQIILRLPFDKLDNPIGSYPIVSDATHSGMMPGMVEMNYYNKASSEIIFTSRADPKGSPDVGTLTITEFEKGDGAFSQRQINWLKGTFSATLKATKQGYKTGEVIEITAGAFNMPNALFQL